MKTLVYHFVELVGVRAAAARHDTSSADGPPLAGFVLIVAPEVEISEFVMHLLDVLRRLQIYFAVSSDDGCWIFGYLKDIFDLRGICFFLSHRFDNSLLQNF